MACANNADPEGAVLSGSNLLAIPHSVFKKQLYKKHKIGQKSME